VMLQVLEAGAEDLVDLGTSWQVITDAHDLHAVRVALEEAKVAVESSDLIMQAAQTVPLDAEGDVRKVLHLIDALDDHDDVQSVWANFEASDDVLELATT
jgi:transcriptional/translational regulatory protein YebC/TACO1